MAQFKAKVTENIPANRLIALGGVDTEGDPDVGWDTIYLITSKKGWIPDLVSTGELKKDSEVDVQVKDNPVWDVETSENVPAGSLVQCSDDGRLQYYRPKDGNHFGYTLHSAKAGEVVSVVRKYGTMPQSQEETMNIKTTTTKKQSKTATKKKTDEKKED